MQYVPILKVLKCTQFGKVPIKVYLPYAYVFSMKYRKDTLCSVNAKV